MSDWKVLEDHRYTDENEWVKLEDGEAVAGITDYAQDQLSDIVYVELPQVGDSFAQGDSFGVVESVKAASDLYMPIGGEVTAVNSVLEDTPEIINGDAYGEGWMIRFKPSDPSEMDALMDAKAYAAFTAEQA
jgi:glycine cleavage system H protein